ncbi:MAG TPA: enoyl-CoA hydratase-related protein, partial [Bryobacteraceae bacterium]|nr:enoyl-CoA hydratase-related protein [Bryobacteraceae bacterium]
MSDTATARVRLEIRESLAFLTLARPEVQNTMNLEFGREFLAAAFAIEAAPAVRAVILTGQGTNFCFGGDLKGMAAS